jgi:hypothetical protein
MVVPIVRNAAALRTMGTMRDSLVEKTLRRQSGCFFVRKFVSARVEPESTRRIVLPSSLPVTLSCVDRSTPRDFRREVRTGAFTGQTSGAAVGFVQCNFVALPKLYAFDFLAFCLRNPLACPLIEVLDPGRQRCLRYLGALFCCAFTPGTARLSGTAPGGARRGSANRHSLLSHLSRWHVVARGG